MDDYSRYEKRFQVFDRYTGEMIIDKTTVGRPMPNGTDYSIMYRLTQYLLATSKMFKFSDVRTYNFLSSRADYECKFSASKGAIAEEIGLSRQQVNDSLKFLCGTDLIREQRLHGQQTFYLNPCWQTRGKNRGQLIDIYDSIPLTVPLNHDFQEQYDIILQNYRKY